MTEDTKPATSPLGGLTPHIICSGAADAIAFYVKAFGAEEMMRLPAPDGKLMHATIIINGAPLMMVDEFPGCAGSSSPQTLKGTPVSLHLKVDDVDAWMKRAVDAGATVIMPVADMFWGDRYGMVEDPFGHRWSIATPQRNLSRAELEANMREAMREFAEANPA